MAKRKPLTDDHGEVRELTAEDFKHFVPFSSLPKAEQAKLLSLRKGSTESLRSAADAGTQPGQPSRKR